MSAEYQITLQITVHDFEQLRAAAKERALETMSETEWQELRDTNYSRVSADLHMLFDPGVSPAGTQIEGGDVLFVDGDPVDE